MKFSWLIIVLTASLLACRPADPVDRLMAQLSEPRREEYAFVPVRLPVTASPQQLVTALADRGDLRQKQITSFTMSRTQPAHTTGPAPVESFTAVLLNTDAGQKIILFRPLTGQTGWYYKIYDVK